MDQAKYWGSGKADIADEPRRVQQPYQAWEVGKLAAWERDYKEAEARKRKPIVRCGNCDKPSSHHRKTVDDIGFCGSNCAKFRTRRSKKSWSQQSTC